MNESLIIHKIECQGQSKVLFLLLKLMQIIGFCAIRFVEEEWKYFCLELMDSFQFGVKK